MCITPNFGIKYGDGKMKIASKNQLRSIFGNDWKRNFKEFNKIIFLIKCGKCKECKRQRMLELIKRVKDEMRFWKNNIICTLTYNNENMKNINVRDMQLFFKRLRNDGHKIRYFYAGELGEKTKRPHYHCIIFNYKPKDEQFYKNSKKGNKQYISKELNKYWGLGLVTHQELEESMISYVVKYIMKDETKEETLYKWSKKPPLGTNPDKINELRKKIYNKRYFPKCYKDYYERITKEKIKNENIKDEIEKEQEEIKKHIEKVTGLTYQQYLVKRANSLYI